MSIIEGWIEAVPELLTHPVLAKIAAARKKEVIFPAPEEVFYALQLTPFDQVRVVLLGQVHTIGMVKRTVLLSRSPKGSKRPHLYAISIRNSNGISA